MALAILHIFDTPVFMYFYRIVFTTQQMPYWSALKAFCAVVIVATSFRGIYASVLHKYLRTVALIILLDPLSLGMALQREHKIAAYSAEFYKFFLADIITTAILGFLFLQIPKRFVPSVLKYCNIAVRCIMPCLQMRYYSNFLMFPPPFDMNLQLIVSIALVLSPYLIELGLRIITKKGAPTKKTSIGSLLWDALVFAILFKFTHQSIFNKIFGDIPFQYLQFLFLIILLVMQLR